MARTPEEALQCLLGKLTNAKPVKPKAGETTQAWSACCPAHEDRGPSLSVSLSTSGKILLHCHANCSTAAVLAAVGMTAADLMPAREEKEHRPRERFDLAVLAAAKSLPIDHLRALGVSNAGRGSVKIEYRLADGTPAQRHRLRMRMHDPGRFAWTDGEGSPVPYGLWRLGEARAAGTLKDYLVLVEGESDCWVGWLHGIQMLGLPGSKMTHCLAAEHLEGISRVLVIREPGQGGAEFTKGVGERLATIGWKGEAKEVELPAKDPGDLHTKLGANSVDFISSFKAAVARGKPLGVKPRFRLISMAELMATDFRRRYLVKNILVAGQECVCGGKSKAMKTTLMAEMALSLATQTPFLGSFEVCSRERVWMMSGETDGGTIQETMARMAKAKGIAPSSAEGNLFWEFKLPRISIREDLDAIRTIIAEEKIGVLVIDPAYLSLLGAGEGASASNVFAMGTILQGLSEIRAETGCTIILCHHCKKGGGSHPAQKAAEFQPPELEDLSMAGFTEWARQWILLARREQFEPGSGLHRLWISVGGSVGHSGLWPVDIDEGRLSSDFTGRKWEVAVRGAAEAREQKERERQQRATDRQQQARDARVHAVREFLKDHPSTHPKRAIIEVTGINNKQVSEALSDLMKRGEVEMGDAVVGGRTFPGFRYTDPNGRQPAFVPGDAFEGDESAANEDLGDISNFFDN